MSHRRSSSPRGASALVVAAAFVALIAPQSVGAQESGLRIVIPEQGELSPLKDVQVTFHLATAESDELCLAVEKVTERARIVAAFARDGAPDEWAVRVDDILASSGDDLSGTIRLGPNVTVRLGLSPAARDDAEPRGRAIKLTLYPDPGAPRPELDLGGRCRTALNRETTYDVKVVPCRRVGDDGRLEIGRLEEPVEIIASCAETYRHHGCADADGAAYPVADGRVAALAPLGADPRVLPADRCRDRIKRPALHTVIAVDQSGSMGTPIGEGGRTRAEVVTEAVRLFVREWQSFRGRDGDAGMNPDDRLGIVFFAGDATHYHSFCGREASDLDTDGEADCVGERWCVDGTQIRDGEEGRLRSGDFMLQFEPMAADVLGLSCAEEPELVCQPMCAGDARADGVPYGFTASGPTSIGDGLLAALGPDYLDVERYVESPVAGRGRRNVVVLLTDGGQNTSCDYRIEDGQIEFMAEPGLQQRLAGQTCDTGRWRPWLEREADGDGLRPNHLRLTDAETSRPRVTLHTVVMDGAANHEDRQRMQRDAFATGGLSYFVNRDNAGEIYNGGAVSRDDAVGLALGSFFYDILQNNLRFNTWHFARKIEAAVDTEGDGAVSYPVVGGDARMRLAGPNAFYVPSTAKGIVVLARWDRDYGEFRLDLHPPDPFAGTTSAIGRREIRIERTLAPGARGFYDQPWRVEVRPQGDLDPRLGRIPVVIEVLVDHDQFTPTVEIEATPAGVYCPTDPVTVTASLSSFGRPVEDFLADGGKLYAQVQGPRFTEAQIAAQFPECDYDVFLESLRNAAADAPEAHDPRDENSLRSLFLAYCYQQQRQGEQEGNRMAVRGEVTWTEPIEFVEPADEAGRYTVDFTPEAAGEHKVSVIIEGPVPGIGWVSHHEVRHLHVSQSCDGIGQGELIESPEAAPGPDAPAHVYRYRPIDKAGQPLGPGYDGRYWLRVIGVNPIRRVMMTYDRDGFYRGRIPIRDDGAVPLTELIRVKAPIKLAFGPNAFASGEARQAIEQQVEALFDRWEEGGERGDELVVLETFGDPGGCDCSVTGSGGPTPLGLLAMLLVLAGGIRRRRR